jgi:hypothetical protein
MQDTAMRGLILNNVCFYPAFGATLREKLSDCHRQFTEYAAKNDISKNSVIKQTAFISAPDNNSYIPQKEEIISVSAEFFDLLPPISVIAQKPENGSLVLELIIMEGLKDEEITHRMNDESSWLVIRKPGLKLVIATGSGELDRNSTILEHGTQAFTRILDILNEEELQFSDIIRQWNYIEQITKDDIINNATSQHYQIFNDVRSKFYNRSEFINGFPAATGIGTDCGGVTIDIIAAHFEEGYKAIPLKSPVQKDAYSYTTEVLAENRTMSDFCRTSPKFERAKVLVTPEFKVIFISGTAAIKGQVSIPEISAEVQTEMTINNILSLISADNLTKHGVKAENEPQICHLRVYVKSENDISRVKEICEKYFPELTAVYIIADICRPELLVEIEGLAVISN